MLFIHGIEQEVVDLWGLFKGHVFKALGSFQNACGAARCL
jgi:hypothetical protein